MYGKLLPLLTLACVIYRMVQNAKNKEMNIEFISSERYKLYVEEDEEDEEELSCYEMGEMITDEMYYSTDDDVEWLRS